MEPSVNGGLKICTNGHGLLIKMATMTIYGKNLLLQNQESFILHLGIWKLKVYQVCSNDDPRLTLDLFMARSNLRPYTFVYKKY